MSLLYTFREFDQKTFKSNRVLGFMIFFLFSEGRKIPIPEATKLLSILTRYLLLSFLGLD